MSSRAERSFRALIVIAGGLLVLAAAQRPVAALQAQAPQQWEYKSVIEISQNDIAVSETGLLNQAGNLGWELVAVLEGPGPKARQFVLKRPRSSRPTAD